MLRLFLILLLAAALLYAGVLLLLTLRQRAMIYPAPRGSAVPPPGFERVTLHTRDGLALAAAYRPASGDRPTLIFFHGNGDTLAGGAAATGAAAQAGYGVLLPEYRGYGGNPGIPTEQGLYLDGEAALTWLAARAVPADRVVLVGNSLGSGVATELAVRHRVAGLALVSGFTSLPDVAAHHLRLLPARWLVRDRFDNRAKLPRVTAPVLVLHGAADALIPASHATALKRAAPRADLRLVPDAGHELAYGTRAQLALRSWLDGLSR